MKNTGVVRPGWKNILPVAASFLLFTVAGVLAWDRSDPRFNTLIVLILGAMLALLVYQLLYIKNWGITSAGPHLFPDLTVSFISSCMITLRKSSSPGSRWNASMSTCCLPYPITGR